MRKINIASRLFTFFVLVLFSTSCQDEVQKADLVIAVSHYHKNVMVEEYGIAESKIKRFEIQMNNFLLVDDQSH